VNPDDLRDLIVGGETLTCEFKSGTINDTEIVDAVACLANAKGGVLLIGVGDDGEILGTEPRHGDTTHPERLQALIRNKTEPSVVTEIELLDIEGKGVIVVSVPAMSVVVGTTKGCFSRRTVDVNGKPNCVPMRAHEILSRAGNIGQQDYASIVLRGASRADLDPREISRLRDLARAPGGDSALADLSDAELLRALRLEDASGDLTAGAVLLLGTDAAIARHVPTHAIVFQVVERLTVKANRESSAPLLRAMSEIADAIGPYNPEEEVEVDRLFRLALPRFSDVAIREAVANALVHRDFRLLGPVRVSIEDGDLVITNPGGFPEGITPSNVLVAPPQPRNPLLADVFKRAGLVEQTGRGINRIFLSQLALGHPSPTYANSTNTWVEARLRSGPADRELAAFVEEARRSGQPFRDVDLLVLHAVRTQRRITSADAAAMLQTGPAEARAELNRLVESGLLESRGERKGRTYHLAAAVYRRLGERAAYVRTRGFDDLQQETMILTFVARHGGITRGEAAALCHIAPEQASRLLRRLRDEGKLELIGERRTARYVQTKDG